MPSNPDYPNLPDATGGDIEITSVSEWKQSAPKLDGAPLPLPSGKVAKVRTPGVSAFLEAGVIPNTLMSLFTDAMGKGKKQPSQDEMMKRVSDNPELLGEMITTIDAVTVACVVEPPVSPKPTANEVRDANTLYVDEVDFEDKMFIFQAAVGGTKSLERFRENQESGLAPVQPKPNRKRSSKRTGGASTRKS